MLYRAQPLCAQTLAARSHALLRRAGLCLFRGGGHGWSVTCYGSEFNGNRERPIKRWKESAIHLVWVKQSAKKVNHACAARVSPRLCVVMAPMDGRRMQPS